MAEPWSLNDIVTVMRGLGVERAAFHPDGTVSEVVLGPEPMADIPVHHQAPEQVSVADARKREADRVRNLALHGHGGPK